MCRYTGSAGEHQVASQLLLKGFVTSFPNVDIGFDLHGENGCRIQIKTAHLTPVTAKFNSFDEPIYVFHFQHDKPVASGSKNVKIRPKKMLRDICDVVVFWGIEQNRFWIVPVGLMGDLQILVLGPSFKRGFSEELKDMKEMQSLGFSTYDIAQYYGITQGSAWRRLQASEAKNTSATSLIRACENAWDHILKHGEPDPEYKPGEVQEEVHHGLQLEQATLLSECASTQ